MGSVIIGILGGGLVSWLITRSYYLSSARDLRSEFEELTNALSAPITIGKFVSMIETSKWKEQYVDHEEIWFCHNDRTYQIHISENSSEFHEAWMDVFPDSHGRMFNVHLKVSGVLIDTLPFISADGGRYRVPLPKRIVVEEKLVYYWRPDTIDYKIAELFCDFYHFNTLKQVANFTGIEIDNGSLLN